jgi:Fe-S cluster assembly protein SufA
MATDSGLFDPAEMNWQGITLTDAAARQIVHLVEVTPGLQGVRLGIKVSGCAGFAYVLSGVTEPPPDCLLCEHGQARLWVELAALPVIDGTHVDYVREGLNQVFKFHNPKAQHECGCGESFGVEAE